jgi:hypothetical protein
MHRMRPRIIQIGADNPWVWRFQKGAIWAKRRLMFCCRVSKTVLIHRAPDRVRGDFSDPTDLNIQCQLRF